MLEFISHAAGFIAHINLYLQVLIDNYGLWIYAILFLIVFGETGLVFLAFLPGDSLLFAAGALAATSNLNIHLLVVLLIIAAVSGDALNYWIGAHCGRRLFNKPRSYFFNPQHLTKAQHFYERYGNKTIVLARFIPIIRSFAPFVAGMAHMPYRRFFFYNVFGATFWVCLIAYVGYGFGNLTFIQENFSWVIIAIIVVSLLPIGWEIVKRKCMPKMRDAS